MRILSIDFGLKKTGLAISWEGKMAEPFDVVRNYEKNTLLKKISGVVEANNIEKIVMGNPGGENENSIREFAEKLEEQTGLEVVLVDETLSTKEAIELSQVSGMKRKKRKEMEDAFAAAIILEKYLDG